MCIRDRGYFVTHIYGADGISYIDNSCFILESKEKWPLVVSDRLAGDVNGEDVYKRQI